MKNVIYILGVLLLLSGCKSLYGDGRSWTLLYEVNELGYGYEIKDAETKKRLYRVDEYGYGYRVYY